MNARVRAGLVIGLIAVCSALAGAAVDRVAMRRMMPHVRPGQPALPPIARTREVDQRHRTEMLDRMTSDLRLTAGQRAAIDSVLQRTDSSLRVIRTEMQPRIENVFEASRVQIHAHLDSNQKEKFEKTQRRRPRAGQ